MLNRSSAVLEKNMNIKTEKKACVHHWIIQPATSPTSVGRCKLCGEERIFLNIVEEGQPKEGLGRFFEKLGMADVEAQNN
jgi:hypothetical protein